MSLEIAELWLYPIKACAGLQVQQLEITEFGPSLRIGQAQIFDRQMMFVSPEGEFLTQRSQSRLALIQLKVENQKLVACFNGEELAVPSLPEIQSSPQAIKLFQKNYVAPVYEGELTEAVSRFLQTDVKLACATSPFQREVMVKNEGVGVQTKFTDSQQFLVISEESLMDLNSQLKIAVGKDRFRANIWLRGTFPYREDQMRSIANDSYELRSTKACARCKVITVDQQLGQVIDSEPLVRLSQYRKRENQVYFGQYFLSESVGAVMQMGDRVAAQLTE